VKQKNQIEYAARLTQTAACMAQIRGQEHEGSAMQPCGRCGVPGIVILGHALVLTKSSIVEGVVGEVIAGTIAGLRYIRQCRPPIGHWIKRGVKIGMVAHETDQYGRIGFGLTRANGRVRGRGRKRI
jgi:hypothetical protein